MKKEIQGVDVPENKAYNLYLPTALMERLRLLAGLQGTSISAIIVDAAEDYLKEFDVDINTYKDINRAVVQSVTEKKIARELSRIEFEEIPFTENKRNDNGNVETRKFNVIAAKLRTGRNIVSIEVPKVDHDKAINFLREVFPKIGGKKYEIEICDERKMQVVAGNIRRAQDTEKAIPARFADGLSHSYQITGDEFFSIEFEDAATAARIEGFIDDVISKTTRFLKTGKWE